MLVNNMAYSRISLNHIQQKTDLLTIAVIRKRRRWTANMAVARIVSSGEHFYCFLPSFIYLFIFHSGKNILGHFKRHFVSQISSPITQRGSYTANEGSICKWTSTRFVCRHQHLESVHGNQIQI